MKICYMNVGMTHGDKTIAVIMKMPVWAVLNVEQCYGVATS